jgi:phosphatidylinositol alpha-mannosyltransferase
MAKLPSLKIGLVLDTSLDPTDGVQQYVVDIGQWLAGRGHEVHYLVGQTERRQLPHIHSLSRNITVSFNGNRTTIPLPTSRRKLRAFMQEHDFDVLHVQTPHHPLMSQWLILAAKPKTAVVGTFHVLPYGTVARWGNRLLGLALRPSVKRIDTLLAVSPVAAEFAEWSYHKPATVLPNVIDYPLYHNARPLPQYDDDKLTILFLGRLVQRKGCQVLLKAVAKLVESDRQLPPFRVVICGRGQLEPKLRQFVRDHKLQDIVEFAGFVSEIDKPRYYASAGISVFPSNSGESFGIVLLEAMAGGSAAVLAGDNPGYHSVMRPQPDLLFDPKDSDMLAQKLAWLLSDAGERRRLAAWGADYTKGFDVTAVGQKLEAVYKEALRKRRGKDIL